MIATVVLSIFVVVLIVGHMLIINKLAEHEIRIEELEDIINETYGKVLLNPKDTE